MRKVVIALAIATFACSSVSYAEGQKMSLEDVCAMMANSAKNSASLFRDSGKRNREQEYGWWQERIVEDETSTYQKMESSLASAKIYVDAIYIRYADLIPAMVEIKFKHDCIEEGWDFSPLMGD